MTNGATSAQSLISFILDPVTNIVSQIPLSKQWGVRTEAQMQAEIDAGRGALSTPAAWGGDVLPSDKGGLRIVWDYKNSDDVKAGLRPRRSQKGFEYSSADLPGIGAARFSGNSGSDLAFEDAGPDGEILGQLHQLQINDFVFRYAAVPAITVPDPFNAAAVLRSIQQQAQAWVGMQLLDPALSSQLDRLFQVAIDAADRSDSKSVVAYLADIRGLVRRERQDLDSDRDEIKEDESARAHGRKQIAKLAAKVLDFDIRYAAKRLGRHDDERGNAAIPGDPVRHEPE